MGTRLRQLEEGLQIMKLLFTEKRANFKGRYYTIDEAINNPKPVQKPHPPITIGGSGEKVMLKIVAKYADRWNCPAGYKSFEHKLNVLKEHCKAVGRDINSINISEQLLVCIGADRGRSRGEVEDGVAAEPVLAHRRSRARRHRSSISCESASRWASPSSPFMFGDFGPPQTVELFAREVMPAFA